MGVRGPEWGGAVGVTDILTLDAMEALARDTWTTLPSGSVVWLSGELGSGKTTFVRALTRAAGAEPARSPTYALIHTYQSPAGPIVHVDGYRLRATEEAADLDLAVLARTARLTLIEWPERLGPWAPPANLRLAFAHDVVPDRRRVRRG